MKMLRHDGLVATALVFAAGICASAQTSNVTNLPPQVRIVSPIDGSVFYTPTNILLIAKATESDAVVTNVEFFAGSADLGPGREIVLDPPGDNGVTGPVFVLDWRNPPPAGYSLTAIATDSGGVSTVSPPVNISVLQGPPPTNPPPLSVRIINPPIGAVFFAPVDIPIFASVVCPVGVAASGDAPRVSVQFFDGTNSLGFGRPIPLPVAAAGASGAPILLGYPTNVYFLVWTNAAVGKHVLSALASISYLNPPLVVELRSLPVAISVLVSPPPPTNRPAIVNIVSSDPVAVEGTDSWVWVGESNAPPTWAAWPPAVARYFTNCGPKTATFTVHRFGDTSDDLTVNYEISGTASNGVDYVALPGWVTIPAAEQRAFITVVPINDDMYHGIKTVILSLDKSTNYIVGIPARAAAVIVNAPGPCPMARALPHACFRMSVSGPDGAWFGIQCSTDLAHWSPICTNQVINGSIDFIDPDDGSFSARYYRVVPIPNTPSD
ncbi:MAG: Calx-beta domain-containing protein [Limisphaerales bacterium]